MRVRPDFGTKRQQGPRLSPWGLELPNDSQGPGAVGQQTWRAWASWPCILRASLSIEGSTSCKCRRPRDFSLISLRDTRLPKVAGNLGVTVSNSAQMERWQEFTWVLGEVLFQRTAWTSATLSTTSTDPQRPLAASLTSLRARAQ